MSSLLEAVSSVQFAAMAQDGQARLGEQLRASGTVVICVLTTQPLSLVLAHHNVFVLKPLFLTANWATGVLEQESAERIGAFCSVPPRVVANAKLVPRHGGAVFTTAISHIFAWLILMFAASIEPRSWTVTTKKS